MAVMGSFRGVLVAALGSLAIFAQAQWSYGIFVPQDGPMPNYWSGTNCRASGWAQVGEPIFAAELSLNGEIVNSWECDPEDVPPMVFSLKAMFDSSHFANGTTVEVTFSVFTFPTGWWEISSNPDPVVKNKLMIFEHPDPEIAPNPSYTVNVQMSGKNYAIFLQNGGNWFEADYWNALNGSSAVFYGGHGTTNDHWDSLDFGMDAGEYETKRTIQIGSGLPPFNSTGAPPVFFCHIVACGCGNTNNFKTVLYPYYMGWGGPYLEDQALLAHRYSVYLAEYYGIASRIWMPMSTGATAYRAVAEFSQYITDNPDEYHTEQNNQLRSMVPSDLNLVCGPDNGTMRIKSVYTGTNVASIGWYRPL